MSSRQFYGSYCSPMNLYAEKSQLNQFTYDKTWSASLNVYLGSSSGTTILSMQLAFD